MVFQPPRAKEAHPRSLYFDRQLISDLLIQRSEKTLCDVTNSLEHIGEELSKQIFPSDIADEYKKLFGGVTYQQAGENLCQFANELKSANSNPEAFNKTLINLDMLLLQYSGPIKKGGPYSEDEFKCY